MSECENACSHYCGLELLSWLQLVFILVLQRDICKTFSGWFYIGESLSLVEGPSSAEDTP